MPMYSSKGVRFAAVMTLLFIVLVVLITGEVRRDDDGWCLHVNTNYHLMLCHNGATDYVTGADVDDETRQGTEDDSEQPADARLWVRAEGGVR